jgi:hypothetical protein
MYTARLICIFEIELVCHDYKKAKCKLAYVHYLDTCDNNPKSVVDRLQDTDRVTGQGHSKRQQYEVVEYDRILGAEYLVPCVGDATTMQKYHDRVNSGKDVREQPLSDKEVWRRVQLGRKIGSAHATE